MFPIEEIFEGMLEYKHSKKTDIQNTPKQIKYTNERNHVDLNDWDTKPHGITVNLTTDDSLWLSNDNGGIDSLAEKYHMSLEDFRLFLYVCRLDELVAHILFTPTKTPVTGLDDYEKYLLSEMWIVRAIRMMKDAGISTNGHEFLVQHGM
jgi:hypothetical protein